jgi:hypothetical protein
VIDAPTQTLLQQVLRRESRSVLSYVGDAFPWTTSRGSQALETLHQLITEDRQTVAALGQLLTRQRIPLPWIGSYPAGFTTINFIALDYLVPRLVTAQREAIADLEQDLRAVTSAEAREPLENLLAVKRRHLEILETLAPPHPHKAA